jgi:hypothetical protein
MAIDLINYAFIRGKWYSFSDKSTAEQAIQQYNGNDQSIRTRKPVGVLIDETLLNIDIAQWPNAVADAAGVTGDALINPPVNTITGPPVTVAQTSVVTPNAPVVSASSPADDEPPVVVDPWANLDKAKLNLAKRYADAGMMGRAKAAYVDAGGTWDANTSNRLRKEAAETSRYGGDFDFDWSNYKITNQTQLDRIADFAKAGNFQKIKQLIEDAGGTWDKGLRRKLAAEYLGKSGVAPVGAGITPGEGTQRDPGEGYYKGAGTVSTPQLHEQGTKEWRQQFKGGIETGAWKTGQSRKQAQAWRKQHMEAATTDGVIDKDRRKKIAKRFRKMVAAGEYDPDYVAPAS